MPPLSLIPRSLIGAEFAAAAVLITFGAVLGKVSRLQLLVIGIMEVVFYGINNLIAVKYLKYADAGGSIVIHTFGAYFGLALSRVLYNEDSLDSPKEASVYQSDVFAMIGKILRLSSVFIRTFASVLVWLRACASILVSVKRSPTLHDSRVTRLRERLLDAWISSWSYRSHAMFQETNCTTTHDRHIVTNLTCCVWSVFFAAVLCDETKRLREALRHITKISCEGDLWYLVEKTKAVSKISIVSIRVTSGLQITVIVIMRGITAIRYISVCATTPTLVLKLRYSILLHHTFWCILKSFSGTVFLWLFWPSFNAALLPPDYVAQQRSIINTYFSLTAACVTTFVLSPMFQRSGGKWRLSMVKKLLWFWCKLRKICLPLDSSFDCTWLQNISVR